MAWHVAKAVQAVLDAINLGAKTVGDLDLGVQADKRLRVYYTGTFEAMYQKKSDWDQDRRVVLPLANVIGLMAALDEASRSLPGKPSEISEACAVRAARLVSLAAHCRSGSGSVHVMGGYCRPPIG
jgi:hypothetical protein